MESVELVFIGGLLLVPVRRSVGGVVKDALLRFRISDRSRAILHKYS